jgi:hypothetical protein
MEIKESKVYHFVVGPYHFSMEAPDEKAAKEKLIADLRNIIDELSTTKAKEQEG